MQKFFSFIFCLFILFQAGFASIESAPYPSLRETDAARFAFFIPGILQRTYDVSGQKSEWVLGTSILSQPELDRRSFGISLIQKRFPAKLSGIYTTTLSYDDFYIGLNGETGILRENPTLVPLDTPLTDIALERGPFEGNAFRMEFRRQIVDSLRLDLGISSHSNKESKEYTYATITHQPFFALGRDSSDIPFGGRNMMLNTMHLRPKITWLTRYFDLSFKSDLLFFEQDDMPRFLSVQDTSDYSLYHYSKTPFHTEMNAQNYEAEIVYKPIRKMNLGASFGRGNYDISYENLPKYIDSVKDTILESEDSLGNIVLDTTKDTTWSLNEAEKNYETFYGTAFFKYRTLFNPSLFFEYEFITYASELKQDRELGYLTLLDTFDFFQLKTLMGLKRNSSVLNKTDYKWVYSLDFHFELPFHLHLNLKHKSDVKYPELEDLKLQEYGRFLYPNENLKPENFNRTQIDLEYQNKGLFYGISLRHEYADNLIKENWVFSDALNSEKEAFQLGNFGSNYSLDWIFRLGFSVGNWSFYGERGQTLYRKKELIDTQKLYYKGSLIWKDSFVNNKLGVQIRFDYQWFSNRKDAVVIEDSLLTYTNISVSHANENKDSYIQVLELSKYLVLDFEVRMSILSFELYSRIENLNHSKMMPALGYTPEGIRFAYGITWVFKN